MSQLEIRPAAIGLKPPSSTVGIVVPGGKVCPISDVGCDMLAGYEGLLHFAKFNII